MSEKYLPLFRKYRPQSFKDVVGQENLVKALSNAIELGRIANAYLFCGPRGTGKTSCARIFAKSLNCAEGPTINPCQECPSCLDITNASGLDVIEIDAATNRGIDDAKELIAQTHYAPMNGKYKIFIIDEVHMLSNEAFNALLKTFEEPPENVIFILATTEPHKVIETIVSRCQRFDFRRITTDDIVKRLKYIADLENINIADDALFSIAKNVSGGLRDSLALLDQVSILGAKDTITKETIEELLGKVTFDVMYNLMKEILKGDIESCLKLIDGVYAKGSEPRNFTENLMEFLRNIIFTVNSKETDSVIKFSAFNISDIEKIRKENIFESQKMTKLLDKVIDYYKEIKYATNPYLWVELMIIALCSFNENDKSTENVFPKDTYKKTVIKNIEPVISKDIQENTLQKVETPVADEYLIKENTVENIPDKPACHTEHPEDKHIEAQEAVKENLLENIPSEIIESETINEDTVPFEYTQSDKDKAFESLASDTVPEKTGSKDEKHDAVQDANPVTAWANVLNIIDSVPAKFFYSGVGKLIGIEKNKIVIGFVNQNAIMQAKSDTKYKPLLKAVKTALGSSFDAEFRLITSDTKVIDVKLTAKISTPKPSPKPVYVDKLPEDTTPTIPYSQIGEEMSPPGEPDEIEKTSDEEKIKNITYSEKTKAMLETFNGKVID